MIFLNISGKKIKRHALSFYLISLTIAPILIFYIDGFNLGSFLGYLWGVVFFPGLLTWSVLLRDTSKPRIIETTEVALKPNIKLESVIKAVIQHKKWRMKPAVSSFNQPLNGVHYDYEIETPMGFTTFGEHIQIQVKEGVAKIISFPKIEYQIEDWGKNEQNVKVIRQAISA